jgi:hypothetical protein
MFEYAKSTNVKLPTAVEQAALERQRRLQGAHPEARKPVVKKTATVLKKVKTSATGDSHNEVGPGAGRPFTSGEAEKKKVLAKKVKNFTR